MRPVDEIRLRFRNWVSLQIMNGSEAVPDPPPNPLAAVGHGSPLGACVLGFEKHPANSTIMTAKKNIRVALGLMSFPILPKDTGRQDKFL